MTLSPLLPTTSEIQEVFTDSIQDLQGSLHDVFDDGDLLFMRATLTVEQSVQPRDRVRGGVALHVLNEEVTVCPYILREVCSNGTVLAYTTDSRRIQRADFAAAFTQTAEILDEVQAAVYQCSTGGAFTQSVRQMRLAISEQGDLDLVLSQLASLHRRGEVSDQWRNLLVQQLRRRRRPSRFDLLNVVTAVARDIKDPQVRWRLEELGGGMLLPKAPSPGPLTSSRRMRSTDTSLLTAAGRR